MDSFEVGKQFDSFEAALIAKRNYEQISNTVLVIRGSNLLKGNGDFVKSNVYSRFIFKCKAGEERHSQSKGIRKTSTYKMNCPFTVNINLTKDKLTVTHANLNHENHQTDRATFLSYPENVRLTESEVKLTSPMLACGASKQLVKAFISKDREATVPLKLLHNLDSKMRQQKQGCNRKEDLKTLIQMMMQVTNSKVRIIKNAADELIGVFFQDERMATIYEKYPEVIFFDATHNLNNAEMPLFIQLCVDGNGDSDIISLYVCVSESREGVGSMIDEFQKLNLSHIKTKVILGDKDFADRLVYLEKFVNAVLKICLFHVQRTFRRKITSHKRGITSSQRQSALEVLQRLVYSTSDEEYNTIYSELLSLKLEKVEDYYNTNWHNIRHEWTLFGINKNCNYLNNTNNRMKNLNQKLKLIGNRNANLQTFFENLTITVSNISSEKDLKALRGTMRKSRLCYDDPVLKSKDFPLKRYHELLTPFAFQMVKVQYELAAKVTFLSLEGNEAVVNNKNNDKVSETGCSCLFFSSIQLTCRHILQFFINSKRNPFEPKLCATRWSIKYYKDSHPALSSHIHIASTTPVYVQVRNPNQIDQFKKNNAITKEIRNIANNLSSKEQNYFIDKMKDLKNEMINSSSKPIKVSDKCVENPLNFRSAEEEEDANMVEQVSDTALDLSINPHSTPENNSTNRQSTMATSLDQRFNKESIATSSQRYDTQPEGNIFRESEPFSILSNIENVKVPEKVKSVGRPKGRVNTAIGTKRKIRSNVSKSVKKINEDRSVKRFVDKSQTEKTFTIINWLTHTEFNGHNKITLKEIVHDTNVFQRLRNDEMFLGHLKQFCDNITFEHIKNEVCKLHGKPWICPKCNLNLDGEQVQCDVCLDWFHFNCVQMPSSKRFFVCASC